jgi:hypothetical protein
VTDEAAYDGVIVEHPPSEPTGALVDAVWRHLVGAFGADPEHAHARPGFFDAYTAARRAVLEDEAVQALGRDVLRERGCPPGLTVRDRVRLRAVPSDGHRDPAAKDAYKLHRDAWYANPHAQVNQWIAVRDVPAAACCGFWPGFWGVAVANDSERFDLAEWAANGGWQVPSPAKAYPTVLEEVGPPVQFVVPAAGSLVFGGSHLHGPVGHSTGRTRFSLEIRTVRLDRLDRVQCVDDRSRGSTLGEYTAL